MRNLAPIGVSTYSRINHLKQTIEALQKNTLAKESELYIFSDAPQPGNEEIVAMVRQYIHTIDGFKKVYIIERKSNGRVANNRGGIKQLLDEYGKMIFLEEDIVTAHGFLQFMNDSLEYYKYNEKILTISGYSPPLEIPKDYKHDVFVMKRFSAWGAGFWKEKYKLIQLEIDINEYKDNIKNKEFYKKLIEGGNDIPGMLEKVVNEGIDALDVKIMYQQVLNEWLTLYPRKSLVQNIGHDGSGVHCVVSDKFDVELWKQTEFKFKKKIKPNKQIILANQKFRRLSLKAKIIEITRSLHIYPVLKIIKIMVPK